MTPSSILTAVAAASHQSAPEPQTWVIAFAGLVALVLLQNRRRGRRRAPARPPFSP